MRKVLIVDDEKWIRRGLIQSIDWETLGLVLAGEAGNGDDAYALALAVKPDLLFLDMRMPGMDGKELLSMLSRLMPEMLIIVVSGYSDFEYTKEAIRHKAFDYLLKPVKKEDLNAVLQKAVEEMQCREQEKRKAAILLGGNWLKNLLSGPEEEDRGLPHSGNAALGYIPPEWQSGELMVIIGQPDFYTEALEPGRSMAALKEQFERLQPFLFGGRWDYELPGTAGGPREIIVALHGAKLDPQDIQRAAAVVQSTIRQGEITSVSAGMSTVKHDPRLLREACREARQALLARRLGDGNALLPFAQRVTTLKGNYPQDRESSFLISLQSGNKEAAIHEFELYLAAVSSDLATVEQLQRSTVLLIHAIEKQLQGKEADFGEVCGRNPLAYTEMLSQRTDAASIGSLLINELIPQVVCFYNRLGEKQGEKIVEEVKKRIEAYYDQPLSLHQIAQTYYMNPDYLSRIFKKLTGKNFVDYLTDVRISKSKELMRQTKYKNYEIAQMVGYEDYRYFSQIFKKKLGMTIGEYRSSRCLNNQ